MSDTKQPQTDAPSPPKPAVTMDVSGTYPKLTFHTAEIGRGGHSVNQVTLTDRPSAADIVDLVNAAVNDARAHDVQRAEAYCAINGGGNSFANLTCGGIYGVRNGKLRILDECEWAEVVNPQGRLVDFWADVDAGNAVPLRDLPGTGK